MRALLFLASSVFGLRLPTIRVSRPYLPLDTLTLNIQRAAFDQLRASNSMLIGVIHTPPGESAVGKCGVICEIGHSPVLTEEDAIVHAVAFARYKVCDCDLARATALDQPLPVLNVQPWVDVEPEDDEELRARHDLTSRRSALASLEMRAHLLFLQVEQLIAWNGPVAESATIAHMTPEERAEMYHTVHRFAHSPEERKDWEQDECDITSDSNVCMLERAYLTASNRVKASGSDSEAQSLADFEAQNLAEFACDRRELYSFALARLHDFTADQAKLLMEGRSTASRLWMAEQQLGNTRSWLASRIGLGDLRKSTLEHEEAEAAKVDDSPKLSLPRLKLKSGLLRWIWDRTGISTKISTGSRVHH